MMVGGSRISRRAVTVAAVLAGLGGGSGAVMAQAQEPLRIAFADPVSSLDPQLNNNAGDRSVSLFFFDLLVQNNDNALQPGLAVSWRSTGPLTWEFVIRKGVLWHDGQEMTADDVAFSYARATNVPGSVAPFTSFLRTIDKVEVVDPYLLRITTKEPNPNLPLNLASVHIVSRHAGQGATSEDYNTGKALIGTGPFRYVSYVPGSRTMMRRNDAYWGPKSIWANVDYRYVANPAARTAALLAGDVDVIDKVSIADVAKLKESAAVKVFAYPGLRVLVLQPSFVEGPNKYVTGADGKPLERNPLVDVRVRRALNMAINRAALAERLMQGTADAAGQLMPKDTFGYEPGVAMPAYDPEGAKKLLAEAGFPQGFGLALHIPVDRYVAGSETAQAVAQMWSRIGVKTTVEPLTWTVYASRVTKGEFAMTMLNWGNGTGEASYGVLNLLATQDMGKGMGTVNWGHYSSAGVDKALADATGAFDDKARAGFLRDASRIAAEDVAFMPLFHYQNIWAARKGLVVKPMSSDRTVAAMVTRE